MALENLRLLKAEMEKNDWIICSFLFSYKRIEYAVLVNRFTEKEKKKDRYALVKLQFIDINKPSKSLVVEANSKCLIIDTKTLRLFLILRMEKTWVIHLNNSHNTLEIIFRCKYRKNILK